MFTLSEGTLKIGPGGAMDGLNHYRVLSPRLLRKIWRSKRQHPQKKELVLVGRWIAWGETIVYFKKLAPGHQENPYGLSFRELFKLIVRTLGESSKTPAGSKKCPECGSFRVTTNPSHMHPGRHCEACGTDF